MKTCNRCHQEKPLSEFSKHKLTKDGLLGQCKLCNTERVKQYYLDHPEKVRRYTRHGTTPAEYDALLASQGGGCGICGKKKTLRIDHDHACCPGNHSCGKCIRGILCQGCNSALGMLGDSAEGLTAALNYLAK